MSRFLCAFFFAGLSLFLTPFIPFVQRLWRIPQTHVTDQEKAPDALRVGLLGASFVSKTAIVYAAGKRVDVFVSAVASRDEARAAAFASSYSIPHHLGGDGAYDRLLQLPDVDAVYISLPTRLHSHWAQRAIAAGKHVLVEKPIAANADEAAQIQTAATKAGVVVMEAAHYRYHPAAQKLQELVKKGELGQLEKVTARFYMTDPKAFLASTFGTSPEGEERLYERVKNLDRWWYGADELMWLTNATHAFVMSATESRFGMVAEVKLHLQNKKTVIATLDVRRDDLSPPYDWNLAVHCKSGYARLDNIGFPFLWHTLSVVGYNEKVGLHRKDKHYGEGETTFEHQLTAFVDAVRTKDLSKLDASMRTMRLVDNIWKAAGNTPLPSMLVES